MEMFPGAVVTDVHRIICLFSRARHRATALKSEKFLQSIQLCCVTLLVHSMVRLGKLRQATPKPSTARQAWRDTDRRSTRDARSGNHEAAKLAGGERSPPATFFNAASAPGLLRGTRKR